MEGAFKDLVISIFLAHNEESAYEIQYGLYY